MYDKTNNIISYHYKWLSSKTTSSESGINLRFENLVDYEITQTTFTYSVASNWFENLVDYEITQTASIIFCKMSLFENLVDYEITQTMCGVLKAYKDV